MGVGVGGVGEGRGETDRLARDFIMMVSSSGLCVQL